MSVVADLDQLLTDGGAYRLGQGRPLGRPRYPKSPRKLPGYRPLPDPSLRPPSPYPDP